MNAKTVFVFCLSLLLICALSTIMPIHNENAIYDSVIRLHIIANSNSEYDQSLKLKVRDEILRSHILEGASTLNEAEKLIETRADRLVECAENAIKKYGNGETVSLEWGCERYPTRYYKDTVYPAGRYRSLRIVIGEGSGENWLNIDIQSLDKSAIWGKAGGVSILLDDGEHHMISKISDMSYIID